MKKPILSALATVAAVFGLGIGAVALFVLVFVGLFAISTAITYGIIFLINYLLHIGFGVVMLSAKKRLVISVGLGLLRMLFRSPKLETTKK